VAPASLSSLLLKPPQTRKSNRPIVPSCCSTNELYRSDGKRLKSHCDIELSPATALTVIDMTGDMTAEPPRPSPDCHGVRRENAVTLAAFVDLTAVADDSDGGETVGDAPQSTVSDDGVTTVADTTDSEPESEPASADTATARPQPTIIRGIVFDGFKNGCRHPSHDGIASNGDVVSLHHEPRLPPLPRSDVHAVCVRDSQMRSLGMLDTETAQRVAAVLRRPDVYVVEATFMPKRRGYSRSSAPTVNITITQV
jgi:hypothetical protein